MTPKEIKRLEKTLTTLKSITEKLYHVYHRAGYLQWQFEVQLEEYRKAQIRARSRR